MEVTMLPGHKMAESKSGIEYEIEGLEIVRRDKDTGEVIERVMYHAGSEFYRVNTFAGLTSQCRVTSGNKIILT